MMQDCVDSDAPRQWSTLQLRRESSTRTVCRFPNYLLKGPRHSDILVVVNRPSAHHMVSKCIFHKKETEHQGFLEKYLIPRVWLGKRSNKINLDHLLCQKE